MKLFESFFNALASPELFISLSVVAFIALLRYYRQVSRPGVAAAIGVALAAFFLIGARNEDFLKILSKGDNMPIVIMIFSIGFCLWLSLRQAAINDMRLERGEPPMEALESNKKILVWPDLVYPEFIMTVVLSAIFIYWGVAVEAPLEEPANPNHTMNPSKAPWYFLGLQEMLVYFDPWLAGVVLPGLIVVGLMAIPYIDVNPLGSGYYTWKQRRFSIGTFCFGFLVLWLSMTIIGTLIRGPGWLWFWPGQTWDHHRVVHEVNRDLHAIFGIEGTIGKAIFGGLAVLVFFALAGGAFHKLFLKYKADTYAKMNWLQYGLLQLLMISMIALPTKMVLRLVFNIKYVWVTPWFNV